MNIATTDRNGMSVAVPWSLTHYIPLNGFHPLYRALFDHAPSHVKLHAWDNVKLCHRFARDLNVRDVVLAEANALQLETSRLDTNSIASTYQTYFWPPNRVLTAELEGEIEFHHTAPFPSLNRPFVFHCEAFAPVFIPIHQQGSGDLANAHELKAHYHAIFASPLCLGIFSHIPETLYSLSKFFSDPIIDEKLIASRLGLSANALADSPPPEKASSARPSFLFVNSAHQNPTNFFRRGGHIVLRFWKEFISGGRDGFLMLRCARPSDEKLAEYGVDAEFVKSETGRSIAWIEDYLANHEQNRLMGSAHFFLLPSASLHSVSIMQAMTLGAVPVVTDTVGTSICVTDREHGIVLQGVRAANWYLDSSTGILVDKFSRNPELDNSLVSQLTCRTAELLDVPGAYAAMRERSMAHAKVQFSGEAFAADFWRTVNERYAMYRYAFPATSPVSGKLTQSLQDCTLQGPDWARVFEGVTQPMRRIYTGQNIVWELGGAFVSARGNPRMDLNHWSVMAQYFVRGASPITFASELPELGGNYLSFSDVPLPKEKSKIVGCISWVLMPFPNLHSRAARKLRQLRQYRKFLAYHFGRSNMGPDVELALHGVSGYNVLRYFHKYYAIPQSEGEFIPEKMHAGGYSSSYSAYSVEKVLRQITVATLRKESPAPAVEQSKGPILVLEGFNGFNIIRFGNDYYAILQSEGAFDHAKVLAGGYSCSFSGRSIAELQSAIESGATV